MSDDGHENDEHEEEEDDYGDLDLETSLKEEAAEYAEKIQKRGVIYISRIPPFMKPNKVRSCFEAYGEVTRLYLAEEDAAKRKKRKMNGGNGSKQFVEGWVEFADKSIAKSVATSLNLKPIGQKKGDYYYDDLWNLKYLKGFKWEYLTEKLAYERRVRESKLKAAMTQAKRVNAEFVEMVEKNRVDQYIQDRKRKKSADSSEASAEVSSEQQQLKAKRKFRQKLPLSNTHGSASSRVKSDTLRSVFAKTSGSDA